MASVEEPPERILGLDNVAIELPVAGVGPRALAAFLDYVLVTIVLVVYTVAVVALGVVVRDRTWVLGVLLLLGWFVIQYGYFAGFELVLDGQTPGKRALSLRVADAAGGRATTRAILVRNGLRIVDLLFGVVFMAVDPLARRLGDRLAGTLVLHETRDDRPLVARRVPRGWKPADVAVAESYLRRERQLDPGRSDELGRRLLDAVRRDDPTLLEGVDTRDPARALRRVFDVAGS